MKSSWYLLFGSTYHNSGEIHDPHKIRLWLTVTMIQYGSGRCDTSRVRRVIQRRVYKRADGDVCIGFLVRTVMRPAWQLDSGTLQLSTIDTTETFTQRIPRSRNTSSQACFYHLSLLQDKGVWWLFVKTIFDAQFWGLNARLIWATGNLPVISGAP